MKNLSFEYDRRKGRFAGEKFRVVLAQLLARDHLFGAPLGRAGGEKFEAELFLAAGHDNCLCLTVSLMIN